MVAQCSIVWILFCWLKKTKQNNHLLPKPCHLDLNITLAQGTVWWQFLPWTLNSSSGLHCLKVESYWAQDKIQPQKPCPLCFWRLLILYLSSCPVDSGTKCSQPWKTPSCGIWPLTHDGEIFLDALQSSDILSSCICQLPIGLACHQYPHPYFPGSQSCPGRS